MRSPLPRRFRKLSLEERRSALAEAFGSEAPEERATSCSPELSELADVMVESAVGVMPVPLGVAIGFIIDGVEHALPMATEEPSVIAAATYAARIVGIGGGFRTWAAEPVMAAHVYLEGVTAQGEGRLLAAGPEIEGALRTLLSPMESRGGGWRDMGLRRLPECGLLRVELRIDVRDSLGANLLDTAAERVRPVLEHLSGGSALMCILSNAARWRLAGSRVELPLSGLAHACPPGMSPEELGRRIVLASALAREDPERAVTHNKGIMNGISALALATANDTRAVEAAAHAWASRDGSCRGLSRYSLGEGAEGPCLYGELELPLPFATVGGSVGFHPAARFALRIAGEPDGPKLARMAASLGLAQNLAALIALVGEGIQKGHLGLHARRLAYGAGARGAEISLIASRLAAGAERAGIAEARAMLAELRASGEGDRPRRGDAP